MKNTEIVLKQIETEEKISHNIISQICTFKTKIIRRQTTIIKIEKEQTYKNFRMYNFDGRIQNVNSVQTRPTF